MSTQSCCRPTDGRACGQDRVMLRACGAAQTLAAYQRRQRTVRRHGRLPVAPVYLRVHRATWWRHARALVLAPRRPDPVAQRRRRASRRRCCRGRRCGRAPSRLGPRVSPQQIGSLSVEATFVSTGCPAAAAASSWTRQPAFARRADLLPAAGGVPDGRDPHSRCGRPAGPPVREQRADDREVACRARRAQPPDVGPLPGAGTRRRHARRS